VSHSRSRGRKPVVFWFDFQFFTSISRCAMFQSPQITNSRPHARIASRRGMKRSMNTYLRACASSPMVPEGM
jgi:hypothetical protein